MNRRIFLQSSLFAAGGALASRIDSEAQSPRGRSLQNVFSRQDIRVNAVLTQMTLEEKVGQMLQAEHNKLPDLSDIEKYFIGSILAGGSSDPTSGNSLEAWTDLYDSLQSRTRNTRLRIPILFGIDAVHGHNNVLNAVVFPHNIGMGCTRSPSLVERAARTTAVEVRATGINWTFAPCVTVPRDERWGRSYEGFGETPELAGDLGEAAVRGFQGSDLSHPTSVLACAKHFIADGGTSFGTSLKTKMLDRGDSKLSERELRRIHLQGYVDAIAAGVGTIMPSYSSWNGVKCSGSRRLLTEILKDELRFEGFLISDYDAIDEMPGDFKTQIEVSVNAGMDMYMVPKKYRELSQLLIELVNEKRVPVSRIDDAVRRILRVKFAMGLMNDSRSHLADRALHSSFGSAAHRQVARECVRASLVLLKNSNQLLPLAKNLTRVLVAGSSADDIGNQCGGWTITWQGKSGNVTGGGTTILSAIKKAVSSNTRVVHSKDGSDADKADAAIVVIGETPYAEMPGDRASLELSSEDVAVVEKIKRAGIPVVTVIISGRPVILGKSLELSDALVAAWLPGTEGLGVTDVLFGDYRPTGRLSFSWPRTMEQIPINVGDVNYDPLFKYGYGLTYRRK
jgi:beta-glucosidase